MLPVQFSEPTQTRQEHGSVEYKITIPGSSDSTVQQWIKASSDEVVLSYFRAIISDLQQRGLEHYHFRINNGRFDRRTRSHTPWSCAVMYGEQDAAADTHVLRAAPLQVARCMSCDMDCPLLLGITGEDPDTAAPDACANSQPAAAANNSQQATGTADNTAEGAASTVHTPAAAAAAAAAQLPPAAEADAEAATAQQPAAAETATAQPPAASSLPAGAAATQAPSQQQQQQQQQQQPPPVLRSRDSLVRESRHCRVWFDAKGRPMLVVTPKQHIEQLVQLSDAQLLDLWRTAVAVLDELHLGCHALILNQGDNRNHAHLHLKIKVPEQQFNRAVSGWPQQQQQQLRAIWAFRDSLPPEHRGTRDAYLLRLNQAQAAKKRQHSPVP